MYCSATSRCCENSHYTWHGTAYRRIKGTAARPLPFLTAASAAARVREGAGAGACTAGGGAGGAAGRAGAAGAGPGPAADITFEKTQCSVDGWLSYPPAACQGGGQA
eukprot:gene16504-biopygen3784